MIDKVQEGKYMYIYFYYNFLKKNLPIAVIALASIFQSCKGPKGDTGATGSSANFILPTATLDISPCADTDDTITMTLTVNQTSTLAPVDDAGAYWLCLNSKSMAARTCSGGWTIDGSPYTPTVNGILLAGSHTLVVAGCSGGGGGGVCTAGASVACTIVLTTASGLALAPTAAFDIPI